MSGLEIAAVKPRSALARLGLQAADRLVAIDDLVPRDVIDVQLELPAARGIVVERDGQLLTFSAAGELDAAALTLTDPVPGGIRECNNHCEFCFIRGLPQGLRPTLYVFDDDYRYSFLWGNFLTLTNLEEADWARIGYQRLSPLNVSVHATDDRVRRKLLNHRHAPPILPQLRRLGDLGIEVNAQVVLCAGLNTGEVLDRSIGDLAELHPTVRSLSLVPVGLTRYSRVKNIRRPTPAEAADALALAERWQSQLRQRMGVGFVYPSDELYLLAGRDDVPAAVQYDGFSVLSNGVGLLRSMLDEWQALLVARRSKPPAQRRTAWLTGRLAAPALERMADAWQVYAGWRPAVHVVSNHLFGDEVTVSGLLSGADLIEALRSLDTDVEDVVVPRGAFGFDGRCTLDGISAEEVGAAHPGWVHLASTPRELLEILSEASFTGREHVGERVQARRRLQARRQGG
jgi:putative radical SAM enzyme (TIGR03279 family)